MSSESSGSKVGHKPRGQSSSRSGTRLGVRAGAPFILQIKKAAFLRRGSPRTRQSSPANFPSYEVSKSQWNRHRGMSKASNCSLKDNGLEGSKKPLKNHI